MKKTHSSGARSHTVHAAHKVHKAVFPAAGFGTRFLPATKAQPKEMLPIVDKPVIQYLVEEAVASGIKEIVIVTGRGKRAIEDHFDYSYELEHTLVERGKHHLVKEVNKVARLANFIYVRQPLPKGDGDAVLHAKQAVENEPFAIMFGDDIVDAQVPELKQLMNVFEKVHAPVVALYPVAKSEVARYGIVAGKKDSTGHYLIANLVEKPRPARAPSHLAIIGKYIVTPEFMRTLEKTRPGRDGELRLIDGLRAWVKKGEPLYGVVITGTRYDTGDKLGLLKATVDFALKRKDIGPELRKYLRSRV